MNNNENTAHNDAVITEGTAQGQAPEISNTTDTAQAAMGEVSATEGTDTPNPENALSDQQTATEGQAPTGEAPQGDDTGEAVQAAPLTRAQKRAAKAAEKAAKLAAEKAAEKAAEQGEPPTPTGDTVNPESSPGAVVVAPEGTEVTAPESTPSITTVAAPLILPATAVLGVDLTSVFGVDLTRWPSPDEAIVPYAPYYCGVRVGDHKVLAAHDIPVTDKGQFSHDAYNMVFWGDCIVGVRACDFAQHLTMRERVVACYLLPCGDFITTSNWQRGPGKQCWRAKGESAVNFVNSESAAAKSGSIVSYGSTSRVRCEFGHTKINGVSAVDKVMAAFAGEKRPLPLYLITGMGAPYSETMTPTRNTGPRFRWPVSPTSLTKAVREFILARDAAPVTEQVTEATEAAEAAEATEQVSG